MSYITSTNLVAFAVRCVGLDKSVFVGFGFTSQSYKVIAMHGLS